MGDAFEDAVEIGDAVESAIISDGGDAVVIAICQFFAGFIDPHLI